MLLSDIAVAGLVLVSAASSSSLGQTDELNCIFFCASLARQGGGGTPELGPVFIIVRPLAVCTTNPWCCFYNIK